MQTADFNGDGKQDIAYVDGSNPATLHILLGNGDGTFQPGQNIALAQGFGRGNFIVADINADGHLDIVFGGGNQFQAQFAVFRGAGDGTFTAPVMSQFTVGNQLFATITGIGAADVNGDGAADLIATDAGNQLVFILTGDKSGAFVLKTTIFDSGGPFEVFTGDFNGDGHTDFLIHGRLGADVTAYLGNGDGTFHPGVSYTGPNHIVSMLLVDMDGDSHPDIVAINQSMGINILRGNADGTFAATSSGGAAIPSFGFSLVTVADLNSDGILDLVVYSSLGVGIFPGQGSLTYGPLVNYASPSIQFLQVPIFGDFNSDGHLDFAVAATDGLALLLGNADGSLQTFDNYDVGLPVTSVVIANFTADAHPDIAADVPPQNPRILLGNGLGQFTPGPLPSGVVVGTGPLISAGDFNGDGKADLLMGGVSSSSVVSYGNGDATFSVPVPLPRSVVGFTGSALGDLNHDGITDIVATNFESIDVFLGQASKTFLVKTTIVPSLFASQDGTAIGDFNKDGKADFVYVDVSGLQVMLGNGDGTFRNGRLLQPAARPTAADIDGDGNPDILTLSNSTVTIFYGNGDGTFQPPVQLPLVRNYFQIVIADMNNDGRPDLVLADNQTIAVIHSTGVRSFGPEVHYVAGNIGQIAVRDVNADGLPDVAVANGNVSVLLGQPGNSPPSGTFTITPEPSALGQPFTVTLTLAPTVTGNVIFSLDGTPLATVPLVSGVAAFTPPDTSLFALGAHSLTASYSGSPGFTAAFFPQRHNVVRVIHPTSTSLSASPNPAQAGKTVRMTVSVTSSGPTASGRVVFRDGSVNLGAIFLDASTGGGVFDIALLSSGTHNIVAAYEGDLNSAPSTSAPVSLVVTALATSTSLVSLPANPQAGSTFALSATTTSPSGSPSGAVSFFDGTRLLGVRELDSGGVAVLTTTFANPGTHSFTAAYQANGAFLGSTSPAVQLQPVPSTARPAGAVIFAPSGTDGGPLTFTAQLNSDSMPANAKIAFFSGTSWLGDANLSSTGMASLEIAGVFPGTHYFTAIFAGNHEVLGASATVLSGSQSGSAPDFDLHLSSSTAVVSHGQATLIQVGIDSMGGFNDQINLTCKTPARIQCALQPATVNGGGNSVIILTAAGSPNAAISAMLSPRLLVAMVAGLCAVLCFFFARANRRLALVGGFAILAAIAGCGGHTAPVTTASTTAEIVTLIATPANSSTGVSHSVELRVMVDPN